MIELDIEDKPHAKLGFSKSSIWLNCPGWYYLKQDVAPTVVGADARLGTKVHAAFEILCNALLDHKLKGTPYPVEINTESSILEAAYNVVDVVWTKIFKETVTSKRYGLETKLIFNETLDIWGYADLWVIYIDDSGKKAGVVFDYKNGRVEVENSEKNKNPQIAGYSVCLQKTMQQRGKSLDYIRGIIYQPNISSGEPYKEVKFTATQLKAWETKFLKAANDIFVQKKSSFKSGDWCKYCECKPICKTYKKDLARKSSLIVLEDGNDFVDFPNPDKIPDQELTKIALNAKALKKFIDACVAQVIGRNFSTNPIEGTKNVESRSRRKWIGDTQKIVEDLTAANPEFNLADIVTYKPKGMTELEAKLASKISKQQARKVFEGLTVLGLPSIQLAAEDDPRPKIESGRELLLINEFDEEYE